VNPVTRSVPSVSTARTPNTPDTSFGSQIAQQVNKFAGERLQTIQKARQERSTLDGQIAGMQGQSFENVEMGGDKWALEGWRVVTAQTMSASLLRAQEQDIAQGAYEQSPEQYRDTLVNRIDSMTAGIPDERTRQLARDSLMEQAPKLVDAHMKQNLSFQEQQNFDALANSVDTISRDPDNAPALLDFASGESGVTAGLSIERRRGAVVQGVINSFANNNPAAYARLEAAGFLNTENMTASQIGQLQQAQHAYEGRLRQQYNGEMKEELTALDDKIASGEINPFEAAEEQARIMGNHGLNMSASEGNQIYDRARAGVEIEEGTRGLNIQAAGVSGDFNLQAELMQDAVIHQESRGDSQAVSSAGAVGIMQLMPATAMNPGFGVRNIFQVARDRGMAVPAETEAVAQALMRDPDVNAAMGKEYLTTMLKRYGGDDQLALVAYNAGAGNADQLKKYGGDWDALKAAIASGEATDFDVKQAQDYETKIRKSYSDNIPDPKARRIAAEERLKDAREAAQLDVLENMGPDMAQNDEAYVRRAIDEDTWRANRNDIYDTWGGAIDAQRVNTEQAMMRQVAGANIQAALDTAQSSVDSQKAVALQTGIAAAEALREDRTKALSEGDTSMSLEDINGEYMENFTQSYVEAGMDFDPKAIGDAAGNAVRESVKLARRSFVAGGENTQILAADQSNTVGTLSQPLQDRALKQYMEKQLPQDMQNWQAENPQASYAQAAAAQRSMEVEYISRNGIVDPKLKTQINLAAAMNWVKPDGTANPAAVAGLQAFTSLHATNPGLAAQYVPDAQAQGKMLAASAMVTAMYPDSDVFAAVDLNNKNDPIANAFADVVRQVGLASNKPVDPVEQSQRIADARKLIDRGNLSGGLFGGLGATDAATRLLPTSTLGAMASTTFDVADVNAARSADNDTLNRTYDKALVDFIEGVVPYMPETSQSNAVEIARTYVTERGAAMGSSFIMARPDEPSVTAQMFPGQTVKNTAAVNTAIVEWLGSPAAAELDGRFADEFSNGLFSSNPSFTVQRVGKAYVAMMPGVGSIQLPIAEIGALYTSTRK
jgi:hypothetical protein